MIKTLRETIGGLWSLLVGMKITAINFKSPEITVHYPRQVVPDLEGFRGHIELVPKEDDPFKSKCTACSNCVRICPTSCISMKAAKPKKKEAPAAEAEGSQEPAAKKPKAKPEPVLFELNFNYCSLCGLCVQSCPTNALRFSDDVYLAGFTRQEFVFDLLARLQNQAQKKEQ